MILSYLIVIAFCIVVIYYSISVTSYQFTTNQKTIAVGMPVAYISVSLIIGFGLTIVRVIQVMIDDFKNKKQEEGHISEGLL